MYTRQFTMRLYLAAARCGDFAWRVIQILAVGAVLYMAATQVYVGCARAEEYHGGELRLNRAGQKTVLR